MSIKLTNRLLGGKYPQCFRAQVFNRGPVTPTAGGLQNFGLIDINILYFIMQLTDIVVTGIGIT